MTTPISIHSNPIAVFGARGGQGGAVAQLLLAGGTPVRALSRSQASVDHLVAAGAVHATADLSDATTLDAALDDVDAAFVMIPFDTPGDVHTAFVDTVIEALRRNAVPLTVFTLSGPVPTAPTGSSSLDARRRALDAIHGSDLPIIAFTPGGYLENLLGPWVAPAIVHQGMIPYPLPAALRRPWISLHDQARLAEAALSRPDLAGRTFAVGHDASGDDLATAVSAALGRPVQWTALDLDDFEASVGQVLGPQAARELTLEYRLTAESPAVADAPIDYTEATTELSVDLTPLGAWAGAQDWVAAANP